MAILKRSLAWTLMGGALALSLVSASANSQEKASHSLEAIAQLSSKSSSQPTASAWRELEKGLSVARFPTKKKSLHGDSKVTIVKVDLEHYALKLYTAAEYGNFRTADQWAEEFGLQAVINTGMFEPDYSSTGYMKNLGKVSNPRFKSGYNVMMAFDPVAKGLPKAQIVDRKCQDFLVAQQQYGTLIQSLRMIDCHRENTWGKTRKMWSTAAIGKDKQGHLLLIHSRSPYTVRDLVDELLAMPIGIQSTMYVEGGPEASLYVNAGGTQVRQMGSYETGFNENNNNNEFWPIPNVIGLKRK